MCGICGVMYGPGGVDAAEPTPSEAAAIMLRAMLRRGRDATGVMYPGIGAGVVDVVRVAEPADRVDVVVPERVQWWVGHVRYATNGSPSYAGNNHPIHHGRIVGVHNGVLHNHTEILADTGRADPKASVDSEALFAAINAAGARAGLERVRGSLAAAWVHLGWPSRQLYLARNAGRPLWVGEASTGSTYFASEPEALKALGVSFTTCSPLKPGTYLALVPGGVKWTRRFQPAHPARHASSRPRVPAPARVSRERPWFLQDDYEFPARSTS
jgi:glutamine phosphoribosylpyrophosphate amidotransferase